MTFTKIGEGGVVCLIEKPYPLDVNNNYIPCNKFSKAKDYVEIGIDAEDYYRIKDVKSNE